MKVKTQMSIRLEVRDNRAKKLVKFLPFKKNLVLDTGLNNMAQKAGTPVSPAASFTFCNVGSGSTSNSINSGGITFTQVTTTLTASAGFFTAGMVGGIFKYGTGSGGTEQYITAFTSSTIVTVSSSATVATPTVGTVWQVQQTGLVTPLFQSNTYQTSGGSCGTTYSGGVITHQRTFTFPTQGSPYTVNEVGWGSVASNNINGRTTVGSLVVGTSNFLVVVLQLQLTYSPASPTAHANTGTGLSDAGNIMLDSVGPNALTIVNTNGTNGSAGFLDGNGGSPNTVLVCQTWTQRGSPSTTTLANGTVLAGFAGSCNWAYAGAANNPGIMTSSWNFTVSAAGQSLFGYTLTNSASGTGLGVYLDLLFTATVTLPTGSFISTGTWQLVYGRTLVN
jgi:hypothetical protein